MKKRELSSFMTQELLYDYVKGILDEERKSSVLEALQRSEEAQGDLKTIQSGIKYFENLSQIQTSHLLLEEVSYRVTYWGQIKNMTRYENWPPFIKWTLEAVLVVAVVITVSLVVPWGRFKDFVMQGKKSELILAEIPKTERNHPVETLKTVEKVEKGSFEDEEKSEKKVPPKPEPIAKVPAATTVAASQKIEDGKKKGFVYRGTLSIVNVDVGTDKLKDKIVELGGRKAGEVELGWKRNQGDYYFHFTIPEAKLQELQEYLKTLGTIQLSRDPHPRAMPDGIVRMIITTEEPK